MTGRPSSAHCIGILALAAALLPARALAEVPEGLDGGLQALAVGRCADAAEIARGLVAATPGEPGPWRLLGDASRCLGAPRQAVLAYLRLLDIVGTDREVEGLVDGLRAGLGDLRVSVEAERPAPLRVQIEFDGEELPAPARLEPDGTWLLRDLVPGRPATLVVGGVGVEELRQPVPAVPPAGKVSIRVAPAWLGIGVLQVQGPLPDGMVVEYLGDAGWQRLEPGRPARVTAGAVVVAVVASLGRVETVVPVGPDSRAIFDPAPWLPSTLLVSGAPAGSELRVFLEAVEPPLELAFRVDEETGEIDPEWGIRIAPPQQLDGLVGGTGSLVVQHAQLGSIGREVVLSRGAANGMELDWRSMEGSGAMRARRLAWSAQEQRIRRAARAGIATGAALAAVGAIACGAGWAAAADSSVDARKAREAAMRGEPPPGGSAGWFLLHEAALRRERAWITVGLASAGFGAAGIGVAGAFGVRGRRGLERLGPWVAP